MGVFWKNGKSGLGRQQNVQRRAHLWSPQGRTEESTGKVSGQDNSILLYLPLSLHCYVFILICLCFSVWAVFGAETPFSSSLGPQNSTQCLAHTRCLEKVCWLTGRISGNINDDDKRNTMIRFSTHYMPGKVLSSHPHGKCYIHILVYSLSHNWWMIY